MLGKLFTRVPSVSNVLEKGKTPYLMKFLEEICFYLTRSRNGIFVIVKTNVFGIDEGRFVVVKTNVYRIDGGRLVLVVFFFFFFFFVFSFVFVFVFSHFEHVAIVFCTDPLLSFWKDCFFSK